MVEYGIRIDSIKQYQDILNETYEPHNSMDKMVYAKMREWFHACGEPELKYLYLGSEFCGKRFPILEEWRKAMMYCLIEKKTLVMTVPVMDNRLLERVIQYLYVLDQEFDLRYLEIEVNDYGLLHRLSKKEKFNFMPKIRLGRLLDKSFHDGRMDERETLRLYQNCKIKWTEDEHWVPEAVKKVFYRYPISGIDMDIPTGSLKNKMSSDEEGYSIGLFVPYSYVTTGGICQMQNVGRPVDKKFNNNDESCNKKCVELYEIMKKRVIDIHEENPKLGNGYILRNIMLYRVGNTVFYMRENHPNDIIKQGKIKRIIFEPKFCV